MKRLRFNVAPALLLLTLSVGAPAQTDGNTSGQAENATNRETMATMHHQMAEAHKKMADCLESDRPLDECREEMASRCTSMHSMMGKGMMGKGMMGKGMMGKGMMGKGGMYGCPMSGASEQPTNHDKK